MIDGIYSVWSSAIKDAKKKMLAQDERVQEERNKYLERQPITRINRMGLPRKDG